MNDGVNGVALAVFIFFFLLVTAWASWPRRSSCMRKAPPPELPGTPGCLGRKGPLPIIARYAAPLRHTHHALHERTG